MKARHPLSVNKNLPAAAIPQVYCERVAGQGVMSRLASEQIRTGFGGAGGARKAVTPQWRVGDQAVAGTADTGWVSGGARDAVACPPP